MKSVMIDIETLSTQKDAMVISIGAAVFDMVRGVSDTFHWRLKFGCWEGHVDPKTIRWWMEQSQEAREATFLGDDDLRVASHEVAIQLHALTKNADEVWANDPTFDIVILRAWWERLGVQAPFPIHYRAERSCRTLFALARERQIDLTPAFVGVTSHNAVEDAAAQARAVILAKKGLWPTS
jgi:hypothetical protein